MTHEPARDATLLFRSQSVILLGQLACSGEAAPAKHTDVRSRGCFQEYQQ
jgi:hypothetical protein